MYWQEVQYPQEAFRPQGDPSDWFDPAWMAAVDQENHQTAVMPVYPIPYFYWQPYIFFQMEPDDQVNPAYAESWQNLSTMLMPEYTSEQLHGAVHEWPSFFQVLSTPTFLPDGTGVTPPTQTKPSPGVGTGRTSTRRPGT